MIGHPILNTDVYYVCVKCITLGNISHIVTRIKGYIVSDMHCLITVHVCSGNAEVTLQCGAGTTKYRTLVAQQVHTKQKMLHILQKYYCF